MKINYWLIALLIISFILGIKYQKLLRLLKQKLDLPFSHIKSYWIISLILLFISGVLNFLNFKYTSALNKNLFSELINSFTFFIFAIFTGYFAFKQIQEERFDKLSDQALSFMRSGGYDNLRAKKLYEEAYRIKHNETSLVQNFAELCLIMQNNKQFEQLLNNLEKLEENDKDQIVIHYLKIAKELFTESVGLAKSRLKDLILFINSNPHALEGFDWSFKEIKNSGPYKSLEAASEAKQIFDDLIHFLEKPSDPIVKEKFIKKYS